MSKARPQFNAFNAGEFGDHALARVDLQNYARGAERMVNIFPLVQGGMRKAPGSRDIGATAASDADSAVELIPFVFAEGDSLALELTDNRMRFVFAGDDRRGGLVTVAGASAIVGPWTDESGAADSGGSTAPSGGSGGYGSGTGTTSGSGGGSEWDWDPDGYVP